MSIRMKAVIFAGSSEKMPEKFYRAGFQVGKILTARGFEIWTGGGGGRSMMGAVSDGALAAGGKVTGVILRKFLDVKHNRIALKVVDTFPQRKRALFRVADIFVIVPGAYGTLDEFFEVIAHKQAGFLRQEVFVLNVHGYFDTLFEFFRQVQNQNFIRRHDDSLFKIVRSVDELKRTDLILL